MEDAMSGDVLCLGVALITIACFVLHLITEEK